MKLFKLFFLLFSLQLLAQNSLTSNGSKKVYFYDSELRQTDSINASFFKEVILKSDLDTSSLVNLYKLDGTKVSRIYISYFNSTFGKKDSIIKNGPQTIYHDNGINKKISFFINNSKIGDEYQYNDKGVLTLESTFSNNILNGPENGYYETGEIKFTHNHINGKIEGDEIGYLKTGEIKYKRKFNNGLLNGEDKGYYKSGALLYKRIYNNGLLYGEEIGYDEDENKLYIKYYDNNIIQQSDSNLSSENITNSLRKISFFYNSGELKYQVNYLNGKINGQSVGFFKSGKKSYILNYDNGILQGLSETYFENWALKSTCTFENGKKNGIEETYEKNISNQEQTYLSSKRNYENGELDGLEEGFYPNGKKKFTQYWDKGLLSGTKYLYFQSDINGKEVVKQEYSFKNGVKNGDYITYYYNGKKETQGIYKDGVKESVVLRYSSDGVLKFKESWKNDLKHGDWIEYYKSGKIKKEYSYEFNNKKGEEFIYDETNSEVIYSVNYINNLKHGFEKEFYENCLPKKEVEYVDGKKNGEEKEFYETGEIRSKIVFDYGSIQYPSLIFYESGVLKEKRISKDFTIKYYNSDSEEKLLKQKKYLNNDGKNIEINYYESQNIKSSKRPISNSINKDDSIKFKEIHFFDTPENFKKLVRIYNDDKKDNGIGYSYDGEKIFEEEYFQKKEIETINNKKEKKKELKDLLDNIHYVKERTYYYPSRNVKSIVSYKQNYEGALGNGYEVGYFDFSNSVKKYTVEIKDHKKHGSMQYYLSDGINKDYSEKYILGKRVDRKLALVIGNSDYKYLNKLKNPVADAKLIAKSLEQIGFTVIQKYNITTRSGMFDAIDEFELMRGDFDINLIYYSGHGIAVNGENYLIPTDEDIKSDNPKDPYKMLDRKGFKVESLKKILEFEKPNQKNIIIFDACRNNPLKLFRGNKGGLSEVQNPPKGTLIAFSTTYNNVAEDGDGDNSNYAKILAKKIIEKNVDILGVFNRVRAEFEKLNIDQRPTEQNYLNGDVYLNKVD